MRTIGINSVGKQSANSVEALRVFQNGANSVGKSFPCLLHLLKQVTSRIEPGSLVSRLGQLSTDRRLTVAQFTHRPFVFS